MIIVETECEEQEEGGGDKHQVARLEGGLAEEDKIIGGKGDENPGEQKQKIVNCKL